MRITLTIDPDVAQLLQQEMRRTDRNMLETLNNHPRSS